MIILYIEISPKSYGNHKINIIDIGHNLASFTWVIPCNQLIAKRITQKIKQGMHYASMLLIKINAGANVDCKYKEIEVDEEVHL